jgi:hypothetical protein
MNRLSVIIMLGSLSVTGVSQTDTVTARQRCSTQPQLQEGGNIEVVVDSSVVHLERNNRGFKDMKGYRIQIFLGPVEEAKKQRNNYLATGLPYSSYVKQIVPEHAIEIGDFVTKQEAQRALKEIKKSYPSAMIITTIIEPPKYKTK